MPWTNKQKMLAARAACNALISNEHRKLILRQFDRAMFNSKGQSVSDPTSTSKKLTNSDFEQYMAIIERYAGGKILHFSRDYWHRKSADYLHRMRFQALEIVQRLTVADVFDDAELALEGWIEKRVTDGRTRNIDELNWHELSNLLNGLNAFAHRRGIDTKVA